MELPKPAELRSLWPYALVIALGVLILTPRLGFGLQDPLEPLYLESVREMGERNSLLVPYYMDQVRLAKPILVYWAILGSSAVLGLGEAAARLPGVIFALLAMVGIFYTTERAFGRRVAWLSALVLGTFPQFVFLARQATPDIYFAVSMGMAWSFFGLGAYRDPDRRRLHLDLSAIALALAILAKGPLLAGALFGGSLTVIVLARIDRSYSGHLWRAMRQRAPRYVLIVLAVAAPWFLFMLIRDADAFVSDFVVYNHFTRALEKIENSGSSAYYLRTVEFGMYPWSVFVPMAFALGVDWRRREGHALDGLAALMAVAFGVVFVLMTASVTKFPHYLAPALIPAAVLIGRGLDRLFEAASPTIARVCFVVAAMLFLLPTADLWRTEGMQYLLESFTIRRQVPALFTPGPVMAIITVGILAVLLASVVIRSRLVLAPLVCLAVGQACYCSWYLVPELAPTKSMQQICKRAAEDMGDEDELGAFDMLEAGAVYYTNRRVRLLKGPGELYDFMPPTRPGMAIVPREKLNRITEAYRKRFPGNQLYLLDDSHAYFVLVTSRRPYAIGGS